MSYSPSLTARTPAAHLQVPSRNSAARPAASPVERDTDTEFSDSLCRLVEACGAPANQHERAIVLILGCIAKGVDTRTDIVGRAERLGFNAQHIRLILKKHCGSDHARHHWSRDDAGRYVALT